MAERDWLIGRVLGKYRLEKQIGAGAFASIYEAMHIHLHVPFAIKILHPAFANEDEVLLRFFREARAASQLQHENVVFIADYDVEEGVGPYIVMEYLEGDTLKKFLSQHRQLPLDLVGEIARQICLALGQAHRKNIVHRDLKPENIFLVQREMGRVLVKVLDFGIAHLGKVADAITGSRLIGTPVYMAPEQFRGVAQSPSIDIYSFGVILYEMLTGQTPFIGHNVQQLGIEHILMPAPELAEGFPPGLRQLQARLLGKTPEERPSSMEEVWMLMAPALDPEGRYPHWHRQDQHIFTGALMPAVSLSSSEAISYPRIEGSNRNPIPASVSDTQDQAPRSVNDTHDGPDQLPDASAFSEDVRPTSIGPLPSGSASDLLASLRPTEEEDIFEGAETMVGPLRNSLSDHSGSGQVYQTLRMPSYTDDHDLSTSDIPTTDLSTDLNLPVYGGAAGRNHTSPPPPPNQDEQANKKALAQKSGTYARPPMLPDFLQTDTKDSFPPSTRPPHRSENEQALSAEDLLEEDTPQPNPLPAKPPMLGKSPLPAKPPMFGKSPLSEKSSLLGKSSLLEQSDSFSLEESALVIEEDKPPPSAPHLAALREAQDLDLVIHDMGDQLWEDHDHEDAVAPEIPIKRAPQMTNGSSDDVPQLTEISTHAHRHAPDNPDEDSLQVTEISMHSNNYAMGGFSPSPAFAASAHFPAPPSARVSSDFSQLSTVRTRNPLSASPPSDTVAELDILQAPARSAPPRNVPPPKIPLIGVTALPSTRVYADTTPDPHDTDDWQRERLPTVLRPVWDFYRRMNPLERRLLMMVWVGVVLVILSVLWLLWPEVSPPPKPEPSPRAGITRPNQEIEVRFISGLIDRQPIKVFSESGRYLGTTPMSVRGRPQKVIRYRLEPSDPNERRYQTTQCDILFDPNKTQITLELTPR